MRTSFRGASLAFALAVVSLSAAATDNPVLGKWTLDVPKSTFHPAPAPKSGWRTYEQSPAGITLTMAFVNAADKEVKSSVTYKEDGQPYPAPDSDSYDSVVAMKIDGRHTRILQKKGGKVVFTTMRAVSEDGKTLTIISKGTTVKGVKYDDKLIYERD